MKVEFTRRASMQLAAVLAYVQARNPAAASRIADRIAAAVRVIGEHPEIGRRQDQDGVRKYVVQPGGYLLFYSIDRPAARVRIFFVTHPARQRPFQDA